MIHSTAVVDPGATLGKDVKIGPYCVVGKDVVLGDRVELKNHVTLFGKTSVGDDTIIYPYASVGEMGQDPKYQEEKDMTGLIIGKRCRIREYVTIQSGTPASQGTKIGDDCHIRCYSHIAHDCQLGNSVFLSNLVQLAGHVEIDDFAILSALVAVHQFCHIGEYAFLGAMSGTAADVPPYVIYEGLPARYRTINRVGLERHGFTNEDMHAIHLVYSVVFASEGNVADNIAEVKTKVKDNKYAMKAIEFIETRATRGINRGREKDSYKKE